MVNARVCCSSLCVLSNRYCFELEIRLVTTLVIKTRMFCHFGPFICWQLFDLEDWLPTDNCGPLLESVFIQLIKIVMQCLSQCLMDFIHFLSLAFSNFEVILSLGNIRIWYYWRLRGKCFEIWNHRVALLSCIIVKLEFFRFLFC